MDSMLVEKSDVMSPTAVEESAIKATEAFLMRDTIGNPRLFAGATGSAAKSRYDTLLMINSRDQCITSSAFAIDYLQRNSPQFSVLALLNGHSRGADDVNPFLFNPNLINHTYALTQDKEGVWRAFSPANHRRDSLSPLRRVFASENLDTLLNDIQTSDGGSWPDAATVTQSLEEGYTSPRNCVVGENGIKQTEIFTIDTTLSQKYKDHQLPYASLRYTLAKK